MSTKENLIEKLESQITVWEKEAEAKQAEAEKKQAQAENEKAAAELKADVTDKIKSLWANIDAARTKIQEIKNAGEEGMADFKQQISDWLK